MLQNYPPPLNLRAEAFISSPLSLTLEPSTHDHYLPLTAVKSLNSFHQYSDHSPYPAINKIN